MCVGVCLCVYVCRCVCVGVWLHTPTHQRVSSARVYDTRLTMVVWSGGDFDRMQADLDLVYG